MAAINWTSAYSTLAKLLQQFYHNNREDTSTRLYELCMVDSQFMIINRWIERYSLREGQPGLDPITIFASFNDRSSKPWNRIERINAYLQMLSPGNDIAPINDIDFRGCPTPMTLQIMSQRYPDEQQSIWELLDQVLQRGQEGLDEKTFTSSKEWRGINIASFTMFLFWIDYSNFLPLDANTTSYLLAKRLIPHGVRDYRQYKELLNNTYTLNYLNVSRTAYEQKNSSGLINEPERLPLPRVEEVQPSEISVERIGEFRLVAMKIFDLTDQAFRKVLNTNYFYQFSHAYDLNDENNIKYDKDRDVKLFNIGDLSVNVSAVVGKNGSGKSTITELLYLAINNLSYHHPDITAKLEFEPNLYIDLYYSAEYLYRISFRGSAIKIFRYSPTETGFINPEIVPFYDFRFDEFFYSVSINYSHFALNELHLGSWISKMFHKNDSYQAPLVINPHRDKGNINVNIEESFASSRLLANILINVDPLKEGEKLTSLRRLTENRSAETLKLKFNRNKIVFLYSLDAPTKVNAHNKRIYTFDKAHYWVNFVRTAGRVFGITTGPVRIDAVAVLSLQDYTFKYMLRKVISIAMTYERYNKWFKPKTNKFPNLEKYLEELRDDYSHVTYKLRQAINFLKYDHLRKWIEPFQSSAETTINVDTLASDISKIIDDNDDSQLQVIHFIPPSFFTTEVFLEGNISLKQLSSGEKQKIYAASTIAYHLLNLNSKISEDDLIPYRFLLVVFDEVELYFHPEMQRGFINYLLTYLSYLPLDQLTGLQLTFITHSPFILSDIPSDNILFMGSDRSGWQTFGANIHDLLADNFFLEDGFMGEHVKKVIQSLVKYLTDEGFESKMKWDMPKALQVIEIVGEPLIKERLQSLYNTKFNAELTREQQIKNLRDQLKRLEGNAKNI